MIKIETVDNPPVTLGFRRYLLCTPEALSFAAATGYSSQTYYTYLDVSCGDCIYVVSPYSVDVSYADGSQIVASWSDPIGKIRKLSGLNGLTVRLTAGTLAPVVIYGAMNITPSPSAVVPPPSYTNVTVQNTAANPVPVTGTVTVSDITIQNVTIDNGDENPVPVSVRPGAVVGSYLVSPSQGGTYDLKPLLPPNPVDLSLAGDTYALPYTDDMSDANLFTPAVPWLVFQSGGEDLTAVDLDHYYFCGKNRSYSELGRFDAQIMVGSTDLVMTGEVRTFASFLPIGVERGKGRPAFDVIVAQAAEGETVLVNGLPYVMGVNGRRIIATSATATGSPGYDSSFDTIEPVGTDMTITCYRVTLNLIQHAYNNNFKLHSSLSKIDGKRWLDWYSSAPGRLDDVTAVVNWTQL